MSFEIHDIMVTGVEEIALPYSADMCFVWDPTCISSETGEFVHCNIR